MYIFKKLLLLPNNGISFEQFFVYKKNTFKKVKKHT